MYYADAIIFFHKQKDIIIVMWSCPSRFSVMFGELRESVPDGSFFLYKTCNITTGIIPHKTYTNSNMDINTAIAMSSTLSILKDFNLTVKQGQSVAFVGATGAGKTSIINALKERGYSCVEENSREIIAEQIINGGEILPWKNQIAFENLISRKRAKQYASITKDEIYFFDRSAIDCIAYLKANNLEASDEILEAIKNCEFKYPDLA